MFTRKLIVFLIFIFTLLSGITWTAGDAGANVSGRIIAADGIGLIIILLFLVKILKNKFMYFDRSFYFYVLFLFINLISLTFSTYPDLGFIEYITHLFIFLVCISLYNLIRFESPDLDYIRSIIESTLLASGLIALIGIIQFFFLPSLFSNSFGGLSGTFRNTGQAGAYFSVFLCLGIAAIISGLIRRNLLNLSSLFLLITALIFTFKRAALLGVSVGIVLLFLKLALSNKSEDKKYFIVILSFVSILVFVLINIFIWAGDNIDGVIWRSTSKFNPDTVEDFSEGFLAENIDATMRAFWDSPILGVGMGNMAGIYTAKYEIHSTYLSILSASGILGIFSYSLFLMYTAKNFFVSSKVNETTQFLISMSILYVGLLISFSYTYNPRKREFWILMVIILVIVSYNKTKRSLLPNKRGY